MPSSVIQWFPGHMAKTKRLITECLPLVDIVIEVLDARIPVSSKNPVLDSLLGQKPRLAVFSKSALADRKRAVSGRRTTAKKEPRPYSTTAAAATT